MLKRRVAHDQVEPPSPLPPLRVLAYPASDTANPYIDLLYDGLDELGTSVMPFTSWRVATGRYDICHVHWPDLRLKYQEEATAARRAGKLLRQLRRLRRRHTRIVWTVHNLGSHEGRHPILEEAFWRDFVPLVDGSIHLSEAGREAALRRHPQLAERPQQVIPHGHYRDAYPPPATPTAGRQYLQVTDAEHVLLFIGGIRPYKNVAALISAFVEAAPPSWRLIVAGGASAELAAALGRAAGEDTRVQLHLQRIPDSLLPLYLAAADRVVLPFADILNSGSALLALSFDRPIVVPRRGAMPELAKRLGVAWVQLYEGNFDAMVFSRLPANSPPAGHCPLQEFAWPAIRRQTVDFYRRLRSEDGNAPGLVAGSCR